MAPLAEFISLIEDSDQPAGQPDAVCAQHELTVPLCSQHILQLEGPALKGTHQKANKAAVESLDFLSFKDSLLTALN